MFLLKSQLRPLVFLTSVKGEILDIGTQSSVQVTEIRLELIYRDETNSGKRYEHVKSWLIFQNCTNDAPALLLTRPPRILRLERNHHFAYRPKESIEERATTSSSVTG